jgi:tRNA (guanine37-N1)-methyltransferase
MANWHINLLTLFPEMFPGPLGHSLSGKALEKGLWSYRAVNIRDFATDKHKTVDDTPFGGGAGMVMRPDMIEKALFSLSLHEPAPAKAGGEGRGEGAAANAPKPAHRADGTTPHPGPLPASGERGKEGRLIYLSPRGRVLDQVLVKELAAEPTLTLLCGRYEGVDQRVLDAHGFEEVSVGDYVLSGGEPAAMILMDACIRLLPGVMGNEATPVEESFSDGLLEYPHYTRPAEWTAADGRAWPVPPVLTSGDHAKVAQWRREQAEAITRARRPDLILNAKPRSSED